MNRTPINDGGPAFPLQHVVADANDPGFKLGYDGMTLRDYFAAKAMQSLIADPSSLNGEGWEHITAGAYQLADLMLAERSK